MAYPEFSESEHNAPTNLDQNDDGEWACSCSKCQRDRREEARMERLIDDYEWDHDEPLSVED
jgi:hypothetical protein